MTSFLRRHWKPTTQAIAAGLMLAWTAPDLIRALRPDAFVIMLLALIGLMLVAGVLTRLRESL